MFKSIIAAFAVVASLVGTTAMATESHTFEVDNVDVTIEVELKSGSTFTDSHYLVQSLTVDGDDVNVDRSAARNATWDYASLTKIFWVYEELIKDTVEYAVEIDLENSSKIETVINKRGGKLHGEVGNHKVNRFGSTLKNEFLHGVHSHGKGDDKSHRILSESLARSVYDAIK